MTAEIQSHLLHIQDFTDSLDRQLKPSIDVATLPAVWENRFLVVDDHESLRRLVASLLARRGSVETVADGSKGLDKVREHFAYHTPTSCIRGRDPILLTASATVSIRLPGVLSQVLATVGNTSVAATAAILSSRPRTRAHRQ